MNQQNTQLPGMEAVLTAHRDDSGGLLLTTLSASEAAESPARTSLKVALVIDRSGSMGGEKLEITKAAVAQFIRSLDPDDRIALVTYDDHVDLVCSLEAPTEGLARRVESIQPGGSTDLYGGWVVGAKVVGSGGRVVLLSDGLANVGRFTDAQSMSQHAALSYERYGVTTTTIGVGRDYDEGLMAGMARTGGGAHYFAHSAAAIVDAFSQERYSAGAIVLGRVSIRCGGVTEQLGHFWGGETKKRVFHVDDLKSLEVTVRYIQGASGSTRTEALSLPTEFGYSEEVRLESLLQKASDAEADMLRVRDPKTASEMKERLRAIVLQILAHPSSDEPGVASVIGRLRASLERLEQLERNYVENDAMMHRKRSMQSSHNLRERAKAYSSFEEDISSVMSYASMAAPMGVPVGELKPCREALALAPIEAWISWEAVPLEVLGQAVVVALEDPRRGFVIKDIERHTGRHVRAVFAGVSSDRIVDILRGS